jgi:hypothetical protein
MDASMKTALGVLGKKFFDLRATYEDDGAGRDALDDMGALVRVAILLVPEKREGFEPFLARLADLHRAVETGVQSTRFDRVQESAEAALRRAAETFSEIT